MSIKARSNTPSSTNFVINAQVSKTFFVQLLTRKNEICDTGETKIKSKFYNFSLQKINPRSAVFSIKKTYFAMF